MLQNFVFLIKGHDQEIYALPGQKMSDGEPIPDNVAVETDRTVTDFYPEGTAFACSSFTKIKNSQLPYAYSVYTEGLFSYICPVSMSEDFPFAKPEHRNNRANGAYILYKLKEKENSAKKEETPAAGTGQETFIESLLRKKEYAKPDDRAGFHVSEKDWKLLARNLARRKNTLLTGPTGSGKTRLVELICRQTGTPLTIIPMGAITDPTEQLVGKMDFDPDRSGATLFDWADFALAVQRPGVVLLDEINRCPRNGYNILFSVLDDTRTLTAAGARSVDVRNIPVHRECIFFATANIGYEYTGTQEMDAALRNRFFEIELDYMPMADEARILSVRTGIEDQTARNVALVATNIRKANRAGEISHSVSTRETLEAAELIADGFPPVKAMEAVFLPLFEKGVTENDRFSERGTVRAMIAGRFNTNNPEDEPF